MHQKNRRDRKHIIIKKTYVHIGELIPKKKRFFPATVSVRKVKRKVLLFSPPYT